MPLTFIGFDSNVSRKLSGDIATSSVSVCSSNPTTAIPATRWHGAQVLSMIASASELSERLVNEDRSRLAKRISIARKRIEQQVKRCVDATAKALRIEVVARFAQIETRFDDAVHAKAQELIADLFAFDSALRSAVLTRAALLVGEMTARLPKRFAELHVAESDLVESIECSHLYAAARQHGLTIVANRELNPGVVRLVGKSGTITIDWQQALISLTAARRA